MNVHVRQAMPDDADTVSSVLIEAASWLESKGIPLWQLDELTTSRLAPDVNAGLFYIAECDGQAGGVVRFQLEDPLFWPDVPPGQSAFIHRLAVNRQFAGGGVSSALLEWAVRQTQSLGRDYLRLDCVASRLKLRAVYERFGFRHHSDRQVGLYFVARYECQVAAETDNVTG
ncbi:MAG TPA: GNAT family N-acetyltransferase [Pirellulales bacterium]|jgi:GNAT superfamily N-acetyltransferase